MARSGMEQIITQVRQLASAGASEYAAGGITYWSDDQLQVHLDRARTEIWREPIHYVPQINTGGTTVYLEYRTTYTWLEQTTGGSAIFYIADSTGALIGTASYTADYANGRITFGADQHGSARYLTARSYDVHEAAALVWESKAAHVADRFDFTADGASFQASKLMEHYTQMANKMRRQSGSGGITTGRLVRNDVANDW
jgi:hypothetical protein